MVKKFLPMVVLGLASVFATSAFANNVDPSQIDHKIVLPANKEGVKTYFQTFNEDNVTVEGSSTNQILVFKIGPTATKEVNQFRVDGFLVKDGITKNCRMEMNYYDPAIKILPESSSVCHIVYSTDPHVFTVLFN